MLSRSVVFCRPHTGKYRNTNIQRYRNTNVQRGARLLSAVVSLPLCSFLHRIRAILLALTLRGQLAMQRKNFPAQFYESILFVSVDLPAPPPMVQSRLGSLRLLATHPGVRSLTGRTKWQRLEKMAWPNSGMSRGAAKRCETQSGNQRPICGGHFTGIWRRSDKKDERWLTARGAARASNAAR